MNCAGSNQICSKQSRANLQYILYHELRKVLFKFCRRHYQLSVKLKALLQYCMPDLVSFGDLVHKFKRIVS